MAKNDLARRLQSQMADLMQQERVNARTDELFFCLDMMQISLGRMGWREKRLSEFRDLFEATYNEYAHIRQSEMDADIKDGVNKKAPDMVEAEFRGTLDNELKQYCGKLFVPYERRHGLQE